MIHPTTRGIIRRAKDAQNQYLLAPDPGASVAPNIWGIPVVLTTQIAVGTALVGDFAGSTAAYVRQGITTDVANQGSTQFTNNHARALRGAFPAHRAPPDRPFEAHGSQLMAAASYRVSGGTQVHVDGVTYAEGEKVPSDTNSVDIVYWLNSGWIEPVTSSKATRSR